MTDAPSLTAPDAQSLSARHAARRASLRAGFRQAWRSNAAVLAPFLLVAFLPRPWGPALAALFAATALAWFFRSWRRHREGMANVVVAQRESEVLSERTAMARAEQERATADLAEAQAEFDAARRDWAAVEEQLRRRFPAKGDERQLVAALKEGMLATLGDQDAPDAATLLRRRTARLRKVIDRYSRAAA